MVPLAEGAWGKLVSQETFLQSVIRNPGREVAALPQESGAPAADRNRHRAALEALSPELRERQTWCFDVKDPLEPPLGRPGQGWPLAVEEEAHFNALLPARLSRCSPSGTAPSCRATCTDPTARPEIPAIGSSGRPSTRRLGLSGGKSGRNKKIHVSGWINCSIWENLVTTRAHKRSFTGMPMPQVPFTDSRHLECGLEAWPRLMRLRDEVGGVRAVVCLERARHITTYLRDLADRSEPSVLQYAKALRCFLSNKAPRFFDANLLAGTTTSKRLGIPVHPELAGLAWGGRTFPGLAGSGGDPALSLVPALFAFIDGLAGPESRPGAWRRVVLERGLEGIVADLEAEEAILRGGSLRRDAERITLLQALQEVLAGVATYAANLSRFAQLLASSEIEEDRKKQLGLMAEVCAHVPLKPARTFREAMNAVWLLQAALPSQACPEHLDEVLYPWFRQDLDRGELTVAEALELAGCLWLKLHDHVDWTQEPRWEAAPAEEQECLHGELTRLLAWVAERMEEPGASKERTAGRMGLGEWWRVMESRVGAWAPGLFRLSGAEASILQ